MNKGCKVATVLVLAVVFCFSTVAVAQAQQWSRSPTWRITKHTSAQWVRWKWHAPNPRFRIYDAGSPIYAADDVVLDTETGLVWERVPEPFTEPERPSWDEACYYCWQKQVANRKGWRPPTIEELLTLVDDDNSDPALPTGHPFTVESYIYWSSTTFPVSPIGALAVDFTNGALEPVEKYVQAYVWCVRGGQGHDGMGLGGMP